MNILSVLHVAEASEIEECDVSNVMQIINSIIEKKLTLDEAVQVLQACADDIGKLYEAVTRKAKAGSADKMVYDSINVYKMLDGKVVNSKEKRFMHDSASSTHISTSRSSFVPGSLRPCNVIISGVNGKSEVETLHARWKGDVWYEVIQDCLKDVLLVENAQVGENPEDGEYILVSTSKLAHDNNIGIHFVAGGEVAELVRDGSVLHRFSVDKTVDKGMYVDKGKNEKKNKKHAYTTHEQQKRENDDPSYYWRRALEAFNMLECVDELDEKEMQSSEDARKENKKGKMHPSYEQMERDRLAKRKLARRNRKMKVGFEKKAEEVVYDKDSEAADISKKKRKKKRVLAAKRKRVADEQQGKVEYPVSQHKQDRTELEAHEEIEQESEIRRDEQGKVELLGKAQPKGLLSKSLSAAEKLKFAETIHARLHNGKTNAVLSFLKQAFGDEFAKYMNVVLDRSCDGCAFAKSFEKHPKHESTRKAKSVGERLHFDVFTAPWRSDTGCKYLLIVIDEYSSYIWGFGMRKKSETMLLMKKLVLALEKQCRRKIKCLNTSEGRWVIDSEGGVHALRCDNAGENISDDMKRWCSNRGITIETSVPETPYQNGRAERAGGAVWKGGAAFRHAAHMPNEDWLHCIRAYIHVRNRLPNESAKLGMKRTPYEELYDVEIEPAQLISHLRTIGSLCYVHKPKSQQSGKPKRSYRAMLLGYAPDGSQKGYIVRSLSSGKLHVVPQGRMYKCYESEMVYPKPVEYDRWLEGKIRARNRKSIKENKLADEIMNEDDDESDENDNDKVRTNDDVDSDSDNDADDMSRNEVSGRDPNESLDHEAHDQNDSDDDEKKYEEKDDEKENCCAEDDESIPDDLDERIALGMPIRKPSPRMRTRRQLLPLLPRIDEDDLDEDDHEDEGDDEDGRDGRWNVRQITDFRRTDDGEMQYRVEWEAGDYTWEYEDAFRHPVPDPKTGATHIEMFDQFNEKVRNGEIDEWNSDEALDDEGENDNNLMSSSEREYHEESECIEKDRYELFEDVVNMMSSDAKCLAMKPVSKGGLGVPQTRKQAINSGRWQKYADAEKVEFDAFNEMKAWTLVPRPEGANIVGVRWVYDHKLDINFEIKRYKARLVAQGYKQIQGVDFNETFAPTMQIKTLRLLLALSSAYGYDIRQYDVSNAFLHAYLGETVYVEQPEGFVVEGKEGWVYKLNKAMYGLKNSPKAYSDHFMSILKGLNFEQSSKDECLWTLRKGDSVVHYLFHVDDIFVASNDEMLRETCYLALSEALSIKDEGEPSLFLGVAIMPDGAGGYKMSQEKYIEKMAARFRIDGSTRDVTTPSEYGQKLGPEHLPKTDEERRKAEELPYQALVGSLIYVSKTRPDVAYAISDVARFMSKWGVAHWKAALRILRYLYCTRDMCLTINCSRDNLVLTGYCDANWGDARETNEIVDDKWKSQYGYIFFLGKSCVSWISKRQHSRAASSMEAEFYSAFEGGKEAVWLRAVLEELMMKQHDATSLLEDNKACISFSKNNTNHERTKHIDIKAYYLRDFVKENVVMLEHIFTDDQLADMLTKMPLTKTFLRHVKIIMCAEMEKPQLIQVKPKLPTFMRKMSKRKCNCLTCFFERARGYTREKCVRVVGRK